MVQWLCFVDIVFFGLTGLIPVLISIISAVIIFLLVTFIIKWKFLHKDKKTITAPRGRDLYFNSLFLWCIVSRFDHSFSSKHIWNSEIFIQSSCCHWHFPFSSVSQHTVTASFFSTGCKTCQKVESLQHLLFISFTVSKTSTWTYLIWDRFDMTDATSSFHTASTCS